MAQDLLVSAWRAVNREWRNSPLFVAKDRRFLRLHAKLEKEVETAFSSGDKAGIQDQFLELGDDRLASAQAVAASCSKSGIAASRARAKRSIASSQSVVVMHKGGENDTTSMNGRARTMSPCSSDFAATSR
jgi:hypothetical protein